MKFIVSLIIFFCASSVYGQDPVSHISLDSFNRMKAERDMQFLAKPYPVFKADNEYGEICNDSLMGKVVLLNFWFAACPPCVAEMEALNKLYQKFKNNKKFSFLSFTFEPPAKLVQLKKKFQMRYPVYSLSSMECYRLNRNNGFPTTIILDETGIIRYITYGGSTDKAEAEEIVLKEILPALEKQLSLKGK